MTITLAILTLKFIRLAICNICIISKWSSLEILQPYLILQRKIRQKSKTFWCRILVCLREKWDSDQMITIQLMKCQRVILKASIIERSKIEIQLSHCSDMKINHETKTKNSNYQTTDGMIVIALKRFRSCNLSTAQIFCFQ